MNLLCDVKQSRVKISKCEDGNTDVEANAIFLISNFHHIPNVVCFLLGNSLASEFYVPMFRNTVCSIFIGR